MRKDKQGRSWVRASELVSYAHDQSALSNPYNTSLACPEAHIDWDGVLATYVDEQLLASCDHDLIQAFVDYGVGVNQYGKTDLVDPAAGLSGTKDDLFAARVGEILQDMHSRVTMAEQCVHKALGRFGLDIIHDQSAPRSAFGSRREWRDHWKITPEVEDVRLALQPLTEEPETVQDEYMFLSWDTVNIATNEVAELNLPVPVVEEPKEQEEEKEQPLSEEDDNSDPEEEDEDYSFDYGDDDDDEEDDDFEDEDFEDEEDSSDPKLEIVQRNSPVYRMPGFCSLLALSAIPMQMDQSSTAHEGLLYMMHDIASEVRPKVASYSTSSDLRTGISRQIIGVEHWPAMHKESMNVIIDGYDASVMAAEVMAFARYQPFQFFPKRERPIDTQIEYRLGKDYVTSSPPKVDSVELVEFMVSPAASSKPSQDWLQKYDKSLSMMCEDVFDTNIFGSRTAENVVRGRITQSDSRGDRKVYESWVIMQNPGVNLRAYEFTVSGRYFPDMQSSGSGVLREGRIRPFDTDREDHFVSYLVPDGSSRFYNHIVDGKEKLNLMAAMVIEIDRFYNVTWTEELTQGRSEMQQQLNEQFLLLDTDESEFMQLVSRVKSYGANEEEPSVSETHLRAILESMNALSGHYLSYVSLYKLADQMSCPATLPSYEAECTSTGSPDLWNAKGIFSFRVASVNENSKTYRNNLRQLMTDEDRARSVFSVGTSQSNYLNREVMIKFLRTKYPEFSPDHPQSAQRVDRLKYPKAKFVDQFMEDIFNHADCHDIFPMVCTHAGNYLLSIREWLAEYSLQVQRNAFLSLIRAYEDVFGESRDELPELPLELNNGDETRYFSSSSYEVVRDFMADHFPIVPLDGLAGMFSNAAGWWQGVVKTLLSEEEYNQLLDKPNGDAWSVVKPMMFEGGVPRFQHQGEAVSAESAN